MKHGGFELQIGAQAFLDEGGEEIGAVREVGPDYVVVYVEDAGDFTISALEIQAAHDGKLILDRAKLDPSVLEAVRHAHEREDN